jgi:hypothetical protein
MIAMMVLMVGGYGTMSPSSTNPHGKLCFRSESLKMYVSCLSAVIVFVTLICFGHDTV